MRTSARPGGTESDTGQLALDGPLWLSETMKDSTTLQMPENMIIIHINGCMPATDLWSDWVHQCNVICLNMLVIQDN